MEATKAEVHKTYLHNKTNRQRKESTPASQQFFWCGTNRTCSIKHESFPRKRRQAATRIHKTKQRKDKRKGTEPRAKSPRRKSNSCPECGVLWAGARCGFVAKDKVFLGKLYLDRWRAQHLSGGRGRFLNSSGKNVGVATRTHKQKSRKQQSGKPNKQTNGQTGKRTNGERDK